MNLLGVVLFLPLIGFLIALVIPRSSEHGSRTWALVISLAIFVISIGLPLVFDRGATGEQFTINVPWIGSPAMRRLICSATFSQRSASCSSLAAARSFDCAPRPRARLRAPVRPPSPPSSTSTSSTTPGCPASNVRARSWTVCTESTQDKMEQLLNLNVVNLSSDGFNDRMTDTTVFPAKTDGSTGCTGTGANICGLGGTMVASSTVGSIPPAAAVKYFSERSRPVETENLSSNASVPSAFL